MPVSTMPAELVKRAVEGPYLSDWSIPKNSAEGNVEVIGLQYVRWTGERCAGHNSRKEATYAKLIAPTNLERSVAPKVSSPFGLPMVCVGSKDIATRL